MSLATSLVQTVSEYIILECRRFRAFPNDRTSILSYADELQILQYCMACSHKEDGKDFDADPQDALSLWNKINADKINELKTVIKSWHVAKNHGSEPLDVKTDNGNSDDVSPVMTEHGSPCAEKEENLLISSSFHLEETNLPLVMQMYEEYMKSNNHLTVLDVYKCFLKQALQTDSDLHKKITLNSLPMLSSASSNLKEFQSLQSSVLELLSCISGSITNITDSSVTTDEKASKNLISQPGFGKTNLFNDCSKLLHCMSSPKTPVSGKLQVCSMKQLEDQSPINSPATPILCTSRGKLKEVFVRDIFRSYIHLLVNSRSQMALARVFNIPERDLNHEAFTHLKHESAVTGLSMYQTLSSLLLRIQLGGQGYAPPSDSPLMPYIKGLGSFLDLIQKLQTVVEEDSSYRSACRKVVNIIKNNLIGCKSNRFPRSLVEPVAQEVHSQLEIIIHDMEIVDKEAGASPQRPVCDGGSLLGRQNVQVLRQFLDISAVSACSLETDLMNDVSLSSQTPTRFPCLLTQFRSPALIDSENADVDNINSTPSSSSNSNNQRVMKRHCQPSEALYLDPCGVDIVCTPKSDSVYIIPSKTIVHPRPKVADFLEKQGSITDKGSRNSLAEVKGKKRKAGGQGKVFGGKENTIEHFDLNKKKSLAGQSDESQASQKDKASKGNKTGASKRESKSCRRRLLPQVKGQTKLTGFFR